jgi:hypothetical protein
MSNRLLATTAIGGVFLVTAFHAYGQTTSVKAEYLMTLYVTLNQNIVNNTLRVVDLPSGWVEGARIKGKIVPPSGDWFRPLASGVGRVDVRLVVQTDDDQIIYVSYNGVQACSKENTDKLVKGELLKADDCYFIIAPTFETNSERYGWLNATQTIGKMVEIKRDSHIKYDIFLIK